MEKKKLRLLHLHRCRGVTRPLLRKMLTLDKTLEMIYSLSSTQLSHYFSLPTKRSTDIYHDLHNQTILASLYRDLDKYKVVTIFDSHYPPLLKMISDPPFVLYYQGKIEFLYQMPALSVVGTRNPSSLARDTMKFLLDPLIQQKWVIVSGMAKGIDGYAHQQAIKNEGRTIAVLGSGFHFIYPKEHEKLFRQLALSQLVISEYAPDTPPRKYQFPERNRIISGLGFGTLVVEAKERSGSLITVEQALEQGREVFAVPGSPLNLQSHGCHKMIQDGAKLVQNTCDIIEEWTSQADKWRQIMSTH